MGRFTSIQGGDRAAMLEAVGARSVEDLFSAIPSAVRLNRSLDLPPAASELELRREFEEIAAMNSGAGLKCYIGAGAYDHFIPAAIDHILMRSEFYTAYTPYQAEVSQGTLQCIYEYQTMIARLTGMDCANASMYDGASAVAEGALMAMRATRRNRVLVAGNLNPRYLEVIRTYLSHGGLQMNEVPYRRDGLLDLDAASRLAEGGVAGLIVQQPCFFGLVDDLGAVSSVIHAAGGLLVVAADPVSLAILKTPGEAGADIAAGEAQSLGIPLSFGGPYAGFMSCRRDFVRNLPGRIIGRTVDRAGQTGFVLTLQTREQHIRREKATSNICSNQALMALASTVYMTLAGEQGFRGVAEACMAGSHYLESRLLEIPGTKRIFDSPFFREFVLEYPVRAGTLRDRMLGKGMLAGLPMPDLAPGAMMSTVTEKHTRADLDAFVDAAAAACEEGV